MKDPVINQATRLHDDCFVIDAHFDLTCEFANLRERGHRKIIESRYLPGFKAGGFDLIVSAIFVHDMFLPEMGLRRALDQISHLHEELAESPGLFRICRSMREAEDANAAGELAIFLSLEGADPIQNDIKLLRLSISPTIRSGRWRQRAASSA